MGRDDLKSKAEPGGFVEYGPEQLPKIDSMRRDKSQPDFYGVPILHDADVLFTRASELGDKPASCYTCKEHTADFTCERLGPDIKVVTVIGHTDSGDPIEYWPCCSLQEYTATPRQGKVEYHNSLDNPDEIGLVWINAPEVGQEFGGANCGGVDGGDDCDHYITQGAVEKWEAPQGACRVLQHSVDGGDVCAAWRDDDELSWEDAQQLMKGDSIDTVRKRKMVKEIVK
jgi:hypothetical protein